MSTGDLVRRHNREDSVIEKLVHPVMVEGKLVPDDIITKLLLEDIEERSPDRLLLDGFPRTLRQAASLEEWVKVGAIATANY